MHKILWEWSANLVKTNFHPVVFRYSDAFAYDVRANSRSDCQFATNVWLINQAKGLVFKSTQVEMKN